MEISNLNQITGLSVLKGRLTIDLEADIENIPVLTREKGLKNLILDFQMMDHMNSDAVIALVKLLTRARREKINMYEYGLSSEYKEILDLTGLKYNLVSLSVNSDYRDIISDSDFRKLPITGGKEGNQDTSGWAKNVTRLKVTEKPEGAMNKNVNNRRVNGPLQGFGPLWEKRYLLDVKPPSAKPSEIITILKQHFPEFQPSINQFYPTTKGIAPGEIVLIDSRTPGGIVSTGVMVLYADDISFALITPQGHPESGWVTFSAMKNKQSVEVKIRGVASASDPFFEMAFRIAGSKLQERIWTHVLSSLANYLEVEDNVCKEKYIIDSRLNWVNTKNLWYNAQIRSLPYNIIPLTHKKQGNE
ncbi:MAG: anti-sigma factor antagonist [Dehalococcoidales bacterium]|nr:MAG: anti-sigma factor antagonist [Dehalococcoidales bacterium]